MNRVYGETGSFRFRDIKMELTIVLVNIVLVLAVIAILGGFNSDGASSSSLDANQAETTQSSETFFVSGSK